MLNPTSISIDHVTIAGADLNALQETFSQLSLDPDYGGQHSNGITHMALLGFNDGSYIELISSLTRDMQDSVFWGQHIHTDGGPCAWAVRVGDMAAQTTQLTNRGIPVDGPHNYHRQHPDGAMIKWQLAFPGNHPAGATLPFLIQDVTARSLRVRPSASVVAGLLTGVNKVVLGVDHLEKAIVLFQKAFHWSPPDVTNAVEYGARLANFVDTPVILATPLDSSNWLGQRLTQFGPSPCAFLLGTKDFEALYRQYNMVQASKWFGKRLAWFEPSRLNGQILGVLE